VEKAVISARGSAGELFFLQENGIDTPQGKVAKNPCPRSSPSNDGNLSFHKKDSFHQNSYQPSAFSDQLGPGQEIFG
jgi:hypothetical protein